MTRTIPYRRPWLLVALAVAWLVTANGCSGPPLAPAQTYEAPLREWSPFDEAFGEGTWSCNEASVHAAAAERCTLKDSGGGTLSAFVASAHEVKRRGIKVRIEGKCASACTIFADMARDNVCLADGANMRLHAAMDAMRMMFSLVVVEFKTLPYSSDIAAWITEQGGLPRGHDTFVMMDDVAASRVWGRCHAKSGNLEPVLVDDAEPLEDLSR